MKPKSVDPFFQDIPWELIYDDKGRQIGEVYMLHEWIKPKQKEEKQSHENNGNRSRHQLRRMGHNAKRKAY
ncbi:hypothetical protein [Paenibacillus sp. IHBB 10380]|uniref:hypothetical protein n=1 Tax=Paenibacillus sp. IHBB 10380 TaxID=1566358 RepID=UPI00139227E5|nr:hypothetical protein [Paenibacillus sp. IHBB 10380]